MTARPSGYDETKKEPTDSEIEVISPGEIMHEVLRSNITLDSLYAIPPLLSNLCTYRTKDSCSYLGYRGNIIPIVIRRSLGIYALAQHSPPQIGARSDSARRIDTVENIRVLRRAFSAPLIKLRQYPFDDEYLRSSAYRVGGPRTDKLDLKVDLTDPIGVIFARVSKDQRNRLRKGLNLGDEEVIASTAESLPPCVRDETCLEGVGKFGHLLGRTLRKISAQADTRESEGFILSYVRDYALLRRTFPTLRDYGLVKLFIAYDELGNPAAGTVLLVSGRFIRSPMALGWLGGSTPDGNRQGLSVALLWTVITWLIRNGYDRYFMGGIATSNTQEGPTHFKRGFGGKEVPGHMMWYSPLPLLGALAGRSDTWRWLRQ